MRASRGRLICVVGGVLTGVVMTALAAARLGEGHQGPSSVVVPTLSSAVGGAITGGLCGFLIWALCEPRQRLTKAAVVLVTFNCAAWLLFLVANTPVGDADDALIREDRARIDRPAPAGSPNCITFGVHQVTLLAGRLNMWVELSEKPLALFAGVAVVFVHEQIVPARYRESGATVAESQWIALAGFVVSTAWWVAAGSMLRSLKRRRGSVTRVESRP